MGQLQYSAINATEVLQATRNSAWQNNQRSLPAEKNVKAELCNFEKLVLKKRKGEE